MLIRGDGQAMTLYQEVGGADFFVDLIEHFYTGVAGSTPRISRAQRNTRRCS